MCFTVAATLQASPTLHISLPLKYYKGVAFRLALLLGHLPVFRLVVTIVRHDTYSLDRSEAPELPLEILDVRLIAQACHKQCLERIASDISVLGWLVQILGAVPSHVLLVGLFLEATSISSLEPGLGRFVVAKLFLQLGKVLCNASDVSSYAFVGREVGRWEVAESWTRCEQSE